MVFDYTVQFFELNVIIEFVSQFFLAICAENLGFLVFLIQVFEFFKFVFQNFNVIFFVNIGEETGASHFYEKIHFLYGKLIFEQSFKAFCVGHNKDINSSVKQNNFFDNFFNEFDTAIKVNFFFFFFLLLGLIQEISQFELKFILIDNSCIYEPGEKQQYNGRLQNGPIKNDILGKIICDKEDDLVIELDQPAEVDHDVEDTD